MKRGAVLGAKLRSARSDTGLTQRQVADFLNVDTMSVSRWERGTNTPTVARLADLAELYGVPVSWFFQEDGRDAA